MARFHFRIPKSIHMIVLVITILTLAAIALYAFQKPVKKETFYIKPEFKLYYANWCPHCKTMMVDWKKLENDQGLSKQITISKIDCAEQRHVAKEAGVKTFPTMFLYINGKKIKYEGKRSYSNMKSWLQKHM